MKLSSFLSSNLQDYEGKISSVVFTQGCNYKCPSCHAAPILNSPPIDNEEFLRDLKSRGLWITGIVICGGEPTLQPDLEEFAKDMKSKGYSIKLDTNGSNPEVLKNLLEKKMIDYVAMDIKGPENLYSKLCGTEVDMKKIKESMMLVQRFPEYEFRTTVVPVYKSEKPEFMGIEDIADTAKMIENITSNMSHKYFLQKFIPRKNGLIDKAFEAMGETPRDLMDKMILRAQEYLPKTEMRY